MSYFISHIRKGKGIEEVVMKKDWSPEMQSTVLSDNASGD